MSVASRVPFSDLCLICERVENSTRGKDDKQRRIRDFIQRWRDCHLSLHKNDPTTTDSFYPAMRLLLPFYDKERGAYGIKEVKLAKYYIELLCLSKESKDAQSLLKYRSPSKAKGDSGDFATTAYYVLKNRCPEKGTLTVEDVNNSLDAIALCNAENKTSDVKKNLMILLKNTTALEQKWLIRMIMKQLKFGVSEQTILGLFHPDAQDLYDVNNSLSKVCQKLQDPGVRLHEIDVSLFSPFRPMLAEVANPNKLEKLLNQIKYYAETKHDGERMQLHMDGKKYMYFSRSGNDYSANFGTTPQDGSLTKYIHKSFSGKVKTCILDGEMIGYNSRNNCVITKGESMDVKALKDGNEYQPCFYTFDILMLNDKVLSNLPLRERLSYLEGLITPIEGRIQYTTRTEISSKQNAIDVLNNAIDNREEGVVIKNPDSVYKLNSRKAGWYKLKPEYVDGLMDNLDLLIVGGYFGEGRRRGLISHFMLGVAVPSEKPGMHPTVFHSFGRVGSGYSLKELYELCMKLNEHWKPYERRNPPDCLLIGSGHKERPDLWIEPAKSHIVQVKAAEIIRSDKFMTGCTLRFPRVETVRYDKQWHECISLTQLEELRQLAEGKLATKHMMDSTEYEEPSPKKKRAAVRMERPIALAPHFKGVDASTVKQIDEVFAGHEMYVINGPPTHSKQALEKLVLELGGSVVQNPGPKTFCVIAHKHGIKVQNIIQANIYDVVRVDWLLRCVEEKQCLQWTPQDMMHQSVLTKKKFHGCYDRFGDSYKEHSSHSSLRFAFEEVERQDCIPILTNDDIAELELEYFPNTSPFGLFRTCRAYFDRYETISNRSTCIPRSSLELTELQFLFYGGFIFDELDEKTTHVIVHASELTRLQSITIFNRERERKFHIVTEAWVKDCVQKKTILPERPFNP